MALQLTYTGNTTLPVEIEGLTPDWACDKSLAEIERFEIFHGKRQLPLAELFRISGDPTDRRFEFVGNLAGVHWLGAHMQHGAIHVHGPVGRHLGSDLRGGSIHVAGDAAGWVGAEMRGGLIHVHGNAGDLVGAAYRGAARGMTGGTILIDGNAGHETGALLRRGLIAVRGDAGDMLGFNMIAGSLLIFGRSGIRVGAGMRRGTIGLFGATAALLPTFRYATTWRPAIVPILLREVRRLGLSVDPTLVERDYDVFRGDCVSVGRGELLRLKCL